MNIVNKNRFSFLYQVWGKVVFLPLVILALVTPVGFSGQSAKAAPDQGSLRDELSGKCLNAQQVRTANFAGSDTLRFVGTEAGNPIAQPKALSESDSPEDAARAYLSACSSLFGLKDVSLELATQSSKALEDGRSVVRFQQNYQGVPVMAGEMIVQMDQQKNILSIVNKTMTVKIQSIVPSVEAETARQTALGVAAKEYKLDVSSLTVRELGLWIYKPSLLNPADSDPTSLVWRFEVRASDAAVNELVLINAQNGGIALKFNQIDTSLAGTKIASGSQQDPVAPPVETVLGTPSISVYNLNHATSGMGSLVCTQSNPSACDVDADSIYAYWYAAQTYQYYALSHNRDSIEGGGLPLISLIHYDTGYQNAFWDGSKMIYGDGFSLAEDVVAHELTHGVTQYESGLFYYYQSGAINESLSDVWGEFVEKAYQGDADWLIGEDLPIGALRDMANPPAYGDPDKMTSANYSTGSGDHGGVHSNSGINNKAAYLMTVGGTFNGKTIYGLGVSKVIKIYYEVQTNLLTSGSDYYDLYQALNQACINLSLNAASGINSSDCPEVRKATQAVQMDFGQPSPGFNPNAPVCNAGHPNYFYKDSFEGGAGLIVAESPIGTNWWSLETGYAATGDYSMFVPDLGSTSVSSIRTGNIYIPAGAYLHFDHAFDFETGWDGGIIEYSTNGGSSWINASSLIDSGNPAILLNAVNPLGAQPGFTGSSHGYVQNRLDLSSLSGQNVMFRWKQGSDASVNSGGDLNGWALDDINLYTCTLNLTPYDFNGDGVADIAIFRPSNGLWAINGIGYFVHGMNGDIPVTGDYNGDGRADIAIYRPSNGLWAVKDQGYVVHGMAGDIPVPADYNGDGKTDIAIYRPSNGLWAIKDVGYIVHGMNGDIPIQAPR